MSKYVKNKDSNMTWAIDESAQTWTLGKEATISVAGQAAIDVVAGATDNLVRLKGDIDAAGAGSEGLRLAGDGTIVDIRGSSHISAEDGIYNVSAGSFVDNSGVIHGTMRGIASDSAMEIVNHGRISADLAVTILGEGTVTNEEGGVIRGEAIGIRVSTFGGAHIENQGKIVADGLAVHVNGAGASYFQNDGKIVGDVRFGSGNDTINNVLGEIVGQVSGGLGDDNYYVGKDKVDLIENPDGGNDQVYSHSSWKLAENLEELYLLGDKRIDATGNAADNVLYGNTADNVLRGKGGSDEVEGFKGDDLLVGGGGHDFFIFKQSYDRDTVKDFNPDHDTLVVIGLVDDFAELASRASQHGDDTWISFGDGDRLILRNVDVEDVTESVVTFSSVM